MLISDKARPVESPQPVIGGYLQEPVGILAEGVHRLAANLVAVVKERMLRVGGLCEAEQQKQPDDFYHVFLFLTKVAEKCFWGKIRAEITGDESTTNGFATSVYGCARCLHGCEMFVNAF